MEKVDVVSRQAAIDEILEWKTRMTTQGLADRIAMLPPAQPEPEWIPVSERLPKENGFYLTSTMFGEVYLDKWNGINWERTEDVLAWMPKPEPYKEGEQA